MMMMLMMMRLLDAVWNQEAIDGEKEEKAGGLIRGKRAEAMWRDRVGSWAWRRAVTALVTREQTLD